MHPNIIADPTLASKGDQTIEWMRSNMPLLRHIEEKFVATRRFEGVRVTLCLHLEAKTAYLAKILATAGAEVAVSGSNPGSTKDEAVASLAAAGLHVYAKHGVSLYELHRHMRLSLELKPHIIIDDGGDIVHILHEQLPVQLPSVWGACEETTTGVLRARGRFRAGRLHMPVLAINDASCKYLFDSRYGTGQSSWDAVIRSTSVCIAGRRVVIVGYGWVGKGCALRAKGLGARTIVCEVDPIRAIEAIMDGFEVMPLIDASVRGDIFMTTTGCKAVLRRDHFAIMPNGAIIANTGHFSSEIATDELRDMATSVAQPRPDVETFTLPNGRTLHLLGAGNLVNITCADGHPADIMDMSFALQALSAEYLLNHHHELPNEVIAVPRSIDEQVAQLKLASMQVAIDSLTEEQRTYLQGWD